MLENGLSERILHALDDSAKELSGKGITASQVTLAAFIVGSLSALAISAAAWWTGLLLLGLSRLAAGLDAALVRASGATQFHHFFRTVLDFVLCFMLALAFIIADPAANTVAGAVLLLALHANAVSFLAFTILSGKQSQNLPLATSVYLKTGLAGAGQTCAILALACLFPAWFPLLAGVFAVACVYTGVSRIVAAHKQCKEVPSA